MRVGLGLAAAAALLFAAPVFAQPQTYQASGPMTLSLSYDGRLYIKVMDIHFDEQVSPTSFAASASMRSYGLLAVFKKFDVKANARGRLDGGEPRPGVFVYDDSDGGARHGRKVEVSWRREDVAIDAHPTFGDLGKPPPTQAQKLGAADPLTQLMRATLASGPHAICDGPAHFFDGKQLYALDMTPEGAEPLASDQRAMGLTSLTRCVAHYREVAGFKHKKGDKPMTAPITMIFGQVGAGGPWVIDKISADTPIGPAVIELREAHVTHTPRLAMN